MRKELTNLKEIMSLKLFRCSKITTKEVKSTSSTMGTNKSITIGSITTDIECSHYLNSEF